MDTPIPSLRITPERVLLVSRVASDTPSQQESLAELARLVETAGGVVVDQITQEREGYDPATLIGSGKVEEIGRQVRAEAIDLVVFDQELSPSQNRNLEKSMNVRVLDRTGVILDIFAKHATTREGKLQVELAQLSYLMPRLVGQVSHWSRLAGGIGTLGPGETLLEVERRRFRDRITRLKRELKKVESHRDLQRKRRQKIPVPLVSLVGYTNAGKSSLMNRLTQAGLPRRKAGVLVEDALFATLDPTVRRVRLPSGREFLLADTVGFVRKLPHQLIEAFKATLREIGGATLLLHVIDSPQPFVEDQVQTVEEVLTELALADKPIIRVFNKMDCRPTIPLSLQNGVSRVAVSAQTGEGIEALLALIEQALDQLATKVTLAVPYADGAMLDDLYRSCRVIEKINRAEGMQITAELGPKFLGKYSDYII